MHILLVYGIIQNVDELSKISKKLELVEMCGM